MKSLHTFSLAAFFAMAVLPAIAQQQPAPPAAAATSASMPMDCGKSSMKRHDHGAERGTGVSATSAPMGGPCTQDDAASATASKAKKKPLHDHAKFHKNQ